MNKRCKKCDKLLYKHEKDLRGTIEVKCTRCKTINKNEHL